MEEQFQYLNFVVLVRDNYLKQHFKQLFFLGGGYNLWSLPQYSMHYCVIHRQKISTSQVLYGSGDILGTLNI